MMAAKLFKIASLFFLPKSFTSPCVVVTEILLCHAETVSGGIVSVHPLCFCYKTSELCTVTEVDCVPLKGDDADHKEEQGCKVQKQDGRGHKALEVAGDEMAGGDRDDDNQEGLECCRHHGMMVKCV